MLLPSKDEWEVIKDIINSRGLASTLALVILGGVLYMLLVPFQNLPNKIDAIIVKLDQCAESRSMAMRL